MWYFIILACSGPPSVMPDVDCWDVTSMPHYESRAECVENAHWYAETNARSMPWVVMIECQERRDV